MALNPMRYSRQVYKFLGQKFSSKIEKMMKNAIEPPATEITDKGRATYTTNRYCHLRYLYAILMKNEINGVCATKVVANERSG